MFKFSVKSAQLLFTNNTQTAPLKGFPRAAMNLLFTRGFRDLKRANHRRTLALLYHQMKHSHSHNFLIYFICFSRFFFVSFNLFSLFFFPRRKKNRGSYFSARIKQTKGFSSSILFFWRFLASFYQHRIAGVFSPLLFPRKLSSFPLRITK